MKRPFEVLTEVMNQIDAEIMVQSLNSEVTKEKPHLDAFDKALELSKIIGRIESLNNLRKFINEMKIYQ
jgi:hypothetical protein